MFIKRNLFFVLVFGLAFSASSYVNADNPGEDTAPEVVEVTETQEEVVAEVAGPHEVEEPRRPEGRPVRADTERGVAFGGLTVNYRPLGWWRRRRWRWRQRWRWRRRRRRQRRRRRRQR